MRLSHWLQLLGHPYALLLYTVTFWSGNMVIGRAFRDAIPPIQLATARWVVALFLCLPFALPHWRNHWPRIKAAWPLFTLLGLLGVGGYNTFAYLALQSTSAINAALLNTFIPIATMLLATLLVGEKLTARQGAGIALAAIGALVVITHGEPQQLLALTFNRGDLWMVMAVLSWGPLHRTASPSFPRSRSPGSTHLFHRRWPGDPLTLCRVGTVRYRAARPSLVGCAPCHPLHGNLPRLSWLHLL